MEKENQLNEHIEILTYRLNKVCELVKEHFNEPAENYEDIIDILMRNKSK